MPKVKSREITYRSVVEQVFFTDETELIIRVGWAEGQEEDLDITTEFPNHTPEWAEGLSLQEIITLAGGI